MISRGVEISIAGGGREMVRVIAGGGGEMVRVPEDNSSPDFSCHRVRVHESKGKTKMRRQSRKSVTVLVLSPGAPTLPANCSLPVRYCYR